MNKTSKELSLKDKVHEKMLISFVGITLFGIFIKILFL